MKENEFKESSVEDVSVEAVNNSEAGNVENAKGNESSTDDKIYDKTWSSVSNSNLSKTFALGSLERSISLKFIVGQKKFWV